jgi:hypothetical protein
LTICLNSRQPAPLLPGSTIFRTAPSDAGDQLDLPCPAAAAVVLAMTTRSGIVDGFSAGPVADSSP